MRLSKNPVFYAIGAVLKSAMRNLETILFLLVGNLLIIVSQLKLRGHALRGIVIAYGLLMLALAFLSYLSRANGKSLSLEIIKYAKFAISKGCRELFGSIWNRLSSYSNVTWFLIAVAVGLSIRGFFLAQPMRYDESFTFLNYANRGFFSLFRCSHLNNHVLNTILIKLSTSIWGAHPASIRFPDFLAGVGLIPLIFCLCRRLIHERSGIFASMAISIFPYMIHYSTNARGYALLALLTLALVLVGARVVAKPSFTGSALISLIAALGMMTMPSMLFSIAGVYLWLVCLLILRRQTLKAIFLEFIIPCGVMTFAFTLFLYSPIIFASNGIRAMVAHPSVHSLPWHHFAPRIYPLLTQIVSDYSSHLPLTVLSGGILLMLVGILVATGKRNWALVLLMPALLFGLGIVFLVYHGIPPARTYIYLIPFALILADAGFTYLREKLPCNLQFFPLLAVILLGSCFAVSLISRNTIAKYPDKFPEASFVVKYLMPLMGSNDIVHMRYTADYPCYFYFWYYGFPQEDKITSFTSHKEFYIVQKSEYAITDLTKDPIVKLLEYDDAVVYRSLLVKEVR